MYICIKREYLQGPWKSPWCPILFREERKEGKEIKKKKEIQVETERKRYGENEKEILPKEDSEQKCYWYIVILTVNFHVCCLCLSNINNS